MSLVRFRPEAPPADLAHLVERDLAKVEVAGSIPVIRSRKKKALACRQVLFSQPGPTVRRKNDLKLSVDFTLTFDIDLNIWYNE